MHDAIRAAVGLPCLPTLTQRPSWHTTDTGQARGQTAPDRAAMLALKASQFAKRVPQDAWRKVTRAPDPARPGSPATSRPAFRAAYTLYADELLALAAASPPRPLAGDYRTAKSNAMRPPGFSNRQITKSPYHQIASPGPDQGLPVDPNRPSIKHLFPPEDLAVWRCGDLVIEGTSSRTQPIKPSPEHREGPDPHQSPHRQITQSPDAPWSQELRLERHRHHAGLLYPYFRCPVTGRRCKLLFLPYATADEFRDAGLAHHWLTHTYDPAPPRHKTRLHPTAAQLLNRYAPLLPPRQATSREALGLRYGEAKRQVPTNEKD